MQTVHRNYHKSLQICYTYSTYIKLQQMMDNEPWN